MPNPYSLTPRTRQEAGRLFVVVFPDELSAFSFREWLCQLEEKSLIEVGDAVVATRNAEGRVRLHQSLPLIAAGSLLGSFGGMVLGMLLLNPLFGSVAGAALGAATATLSDRGIDDAFMKSLAETLTPGSSALFVLVRKTKPEPLLEELKSFAGRCKILQCEMPPENEVLLRKILEGEASHPQTSTTTPIEAKP